MIEESRVGRLMPPEREVLNGGSVFFFDLSTSEWDRICGAARRTDFKRLVKKCKSVRKRWSAFASENVWASCGDPPVFAVVEEEIKYARFYVFRTLCEMQDCVRNIVASEVMNR